MSLLLDGISWFLLLAGGFCCIVGGIGLIRLPGFFCRTHAGSMTDTLGAACILTGLAFQSTELLIVVKLGIIVFLLFITSPTIGYALARAALTHGLSPNVDDGSFDEAYREGPLEVEEPVDTKESSPSD